MIKNFALAIAIAVVAAGLPILAHSRYGDSCIRAFDNGKSYMLLCERR